MPTHRSPNPGSIVAKCQNCGGSIFCDESYKKDAHGAYHMRSCRTMPRPASLGRPPRDYHDYRSHRLNEY